jgi:hypothetical protein
MAPGASLGAYAALDPEEHAGKKGAQAGGFVASGGAGRRKRPSWRSSDRLSS